MCGPSKLVSLEMGQKEPSVPLPGVCLCVWGSGGCPYRVRDVGGWVGGVSHLVALPLGQVLKDPAKPKAKGNYWTVDVSRIPPGALRLQNTAVARGGAAAFARDLTPFVLRGCPYPLPSSPSPKPPPSNPPSPPPFSIASLLRDFPEGGGSGGTGDPAGKSGTPPPAPGDHPPASPANLWGTAPVLHLAGPPWVSPPAVGGRSGEARPPSSKPKEGTPARPPSWGGQLPTSYSTTVAPNAVAPPSGTPFLALRWGVLPPGPPHPPAAPPPLPEVGGAQPMPPNKSIFDVWLSHPGDIVAPALHG